jgi:hypothetical protein
MRRGMGPLGAVSIWSWVPLSYGRPLNLVLYMPFRIFANKHNDGFKMRSGHLQCSTVFLAAVLY